MSFLPTIWLDVSFVNIKFPDTPGHCRTWNLTTRKEMTMVKTNMRTIVVQHVAHINELSVHVACHWCSHGARTASACLRRYVITETVGVTKSKQRLTRFYIFLKLIWKWNRTHQFYQYKKRWLTIFACVHQPTQNSFRTKKTVHNLYIIIVFLIFTQENNNSGHQTSAIYRSKLFQQSQSYNISNGRDASFWY